MKKKVDTDGEEMLSDYGLEPEMSEEYVSKYLEISQVFHRIAYQELHVSHGFANFTHFFTGQNKCWFSYGQEAFCFTGYFTG